MLYLFWIRSAVAQSPIDRDQLSVRNSHNRTLTSPPEFHSLVSHLEQGFLVCGSSPSRLRQGGPQPPIALSHSSAFSFASTFVVPRTNRRPGCEMMTVRKRSFWTHIHSCFCEDTGRRRWLDSGYGTGQFHLLLIGLQSRGDFCVQFFDHFFDAAHVAETLTDHEAVVIAHPMTFQRFDDLWNLWRQAPVPQSGDFLGTLFVLQQRFQHRLTGSPEHVRQDIAELDVRILQDLLHPVLFRGSVTHQRPSPTRQVPQFTNVAWRNETALHQAMPQQARQPPAVVRIGLLASERLHLFRVGQNDLQAAF